MRFCELKEKEVVDCCTGRRLGFVTDLEFCPETGQISSLIVPERGKFLECFCSCKMIYIPFCNIIRIGPDVIIVELPPPKKKEKA